MLKMSQVQTIRELWQKGKKKSEIAEILSIDRDTVTKYLKKEDFNEEVSDHSKKTRVSKLDKYKPIIDQLLEDEGKWFHKQRFTGVRMHCYLVNELGYRVLEHSLCTIQRYMKTRKAEIADRNPSSPGTSELVWYPGQAQADFGEADFEMPDGFMKRLKYLLLSFPYSNRLLCVLTYGENCECVCQALQYMFDFLKRVPNTIVLDNATGIGKRVFGTLRESELFTGFRCHYGFSARFCNVRAGWEKGNVENAVGCFRRNAMVPPLKVTLPLEDYDLSTMLRMSYDFRAKDRHYRKLKPKDDLFSKDMEAMIPTNPRAFNVCRIDSVSMNNVGSVLLDGSHRYSLGSGYHDCRLLIEKKAWTVSFHSLDGHLIKTFERQYGKVPRENDIAVLCSRLDSFPLGQSDNDTDVDLSRFDVLMKRDVI